jgi:predicted transcriptional regulator
MNEIIKKSIEICGGQKQLADKSGVSQAAIHKLLMRKSTDMRLSTIKKLSAATGLKINDFFD